ncbi:MAG TPA: 2-oxo acid dehydrogenase subunit E2 [Puia sp.]|nr:2-oxo acid dehydrogenase subunit E2 [Puia sp.]
MALLQEIPVPLLAVNDTTLTVVELHFSNGDKVKKGDPVMVLETSKTTYDIEAEAEGYIQYVCEVDRDYEVNAVIARIYSVAEEAVAVAMPGAAGPAAAVVSVSGGLVEEAVQRQFGAVPEVRGWEGETLFSAEARQLIEVSGVDRSVFKGRDIVTTEDVRNLLEPAPKIARADVAVKTTAPQKAPLPVDPQKVILEKLTSGKKREIEYLGEVQADGLTSTINIFVETSGIFTHINRTVKYLKDSLLPVILYEVSRLLADYPLLNAYYTGNAIACYKEVNPGFAIDIDKGLKVLKVGEAGRRSLVDIEGEIMRLSGAYLDDVLEVGDLTDITFTITDLSSEGVAFFRPLVNKMNSAILGVSAIDEKLHRCTLSLTFDHRVTEGKLVARFLKELKERLESYRANAGVAALKEVSCFKCMKTLEEDLGGTGFARVVTPEGRDGYICQSCLKGF